MSVVRQHVVERVAILADGDSLEAETIQDNTPVLLLTEDHLLAVVQYDRAIITHLTLSYALVDPVIEDHTVYEDFDDGSTLMLSTCHHTLPKELHVDVKRTSKEAPTSTEAQLCRDEGILYCTEG